MRTVEQAMGEDLVRLAERCDKLEAENAHVRQRWADAQSEVEFRKAENARLKEALRTWAPLTEAKAEVERLRAVLGKVSTEGCLFTWLREEIRAALDEKKSLAADSRAPGC